MLNQSSQHAVRAVGFLAASEGRWVRAKDLAEAADVPFHYLAKLMGQLVRAGLLEAVRGKHGGYRLSRPADQITLYEVISIIEPLAPPDRCLFAPPGSPAAKTCALQSPWIETIRPVYDFLRKTTFAEVLECCPLPPVEAMEE